MPISARPLLVKVAPWLPRSVKSTAFEILDFGMRNFTSARVAERPVFLLGNHKSGTTAIAGLLGRLSGLPVSMGVKRELYRPMFPQVRSGEMPLEEFIEKNRVDFSRPIIKFNQHLFLFDLVRDYFPESPFVMILRDPRDNIRSLLNRLDLPGDTDRSFRNLPIGGAWQVAFDNRWMGIECESYIEQLAHRWNRAADIYLENREQMQLVKYETFCKNKQQELIDLAKQLGLPHDNDITPWLDIQYQPKGNRKITWHEFFGAENLAKIEDICGARMKEFDYQPSEPAEVS